MTPRKDLPAVQLGECSVDLVTGTVRWSDGRALLLSARERALLSHLHRARPAPVRRATLLKDSWHYIASDTRPVDITMTRLRQKLEVDPARPRYLLTVRGVGYRLTETWDDGHSLPASSDRFFGRDAELTELRVTWETGERILTIVGPGGQGKTRLALESARRGTEGAWPGGVWFVDLSQARTTDDLRQAIALAMDLRAEDLERAWATRPRFLLILDGFERLVPDGKALLEAWRDTTQLRLLVTSRTVLGTGATLWLEGLPTNDAARLFQERSEQLGPWLPDEALVRRICEALDGSPLALELAAGRTSVVGLDALLARLDGRLDFLRNHAARDRHRSLRTILDASWDELDTASQRALASMSVFSGGFTIAAAAAVLSLEVEAAERALDELVHRSLLHVSHREGDDGTRFRLTSSVRAFASERLAHLGAQETEVRHTRHFLERGERLLEVGVGASMVALAEDLPDLWAIAERVDDPDALVRVACLLDGVLQRGGQRRTEALITCLERARRLAGSHPRRFEVLRRRLTAEGDPADVAEQLLRALPTVPPCAERARWMGRILFFRSISQRALTVEVDVEALFAEAVSLLRTTSSERDLSELLLQAGFERGDAHDFAGGERLLLECIEVAARMGQDRVQADAWNRLGLVDVEQGCYLRARDRLERSRALALRAGDGRAVAHACTGLGFAVAGLGDLDQARAHHAEAVAVCRKGGLQHLRVALGFLARLELERTNLDAAWALADEARAFLRPEERTLTWMCVATVDLVRACLDDRPDDAEDHFQALGYLFEDGMEDGLRALHSLVRATRARQTGGPRAAEDELRASLDPLFQVESSFERVRTCIRIARRMRPLIAS